MLYESWPGKVVHDVFQFFDLSEMLIIRLVVFLIFLYGMFQVGRKLLKSHPKA